MYVLPQIYGVLPAAVLFTALYGKASSVLPREVLFNVTCIPFFLFFLAYDFILRPNLGVLERTITFEGNNEVIGKILSHWTSALFFVFAEIYSSVSIGILFWKTANDFVSPKEAQRFYPLFAYTSGFGGYIWFLFFKRFFNVLIILLFSSDFGGTIYFEIRLTSKFTRSFNATAYFCN